MVPSANASWRTLTSAPLRSDGLITHHTTPRNDHVELRPSTNDRGYLPTQRPSADMDRYAIDRVAGMAAADGANLLSFAPPSNNLDVFSAIEPAASR